jgi:hypothetical protein
MEVADIIIFVTEEFGRTRDEYEKWFNNNIKPYIEEEYSIKCSIKFSESVEEFRSQIKERFEKTLDEGKLYLSVGVTDLVDVKYDEIVPGGLGEFGFPNIALWVLKEIIIPFFDNYHFRAVFVTNIFNYCEEKEKNYKINKPVYAQEFASLKKKLKEQIGKIHESDYIVDKEKIKDILEGEVSKKFKEIKEKLDKLIAEEITYSSSSDSVYIKVKR